MLSKSFQMKVINTQDLGPSCSLPFAIVSAVEVIGVCHTLVMGRLRGACECFPKTLFSVSCRLLETGHGGGVVPGQLTEAVRAVRFRSIGC